MQPGDLIQAGGAATPPPEPPKEDNAVPQPTQPAQPAPAEPEWQYQADSAPTDSASYNTAETVDEFSWSASEFVAHPKTAGWYMLLGVGAAVLTAVVYLITRNILSAVVVILVCAAIAVYAARQPKSITYRLALDGIHIGEKFYPYHQFKSFSVVDEDSVSSIWLQPLKKFVPAVNMYFEPADEDKILNVLDNFLPQEERDHDIVDRLSHRFRF